MPVSKETLDEIALSQAEYQMILDRLDREPNPVELGMFGALWSEHCGYKHSRPLLGLFPSRSARVLSQSGAENAGAVDIGDGLAVVFKVESHNHPSAVEPFQGAATGVGGIVRDILAMGARPIGPSMSGMMVDALDHVLITVLAVLRWPASTFFANLGSTYGPFLIDLDITFLYRIAPGRRRCQSQ